MRWLNNARIIAILAVVLLHVSSRVITWSELGSNDWWYANLYDSLVRWCVPVFVMISGALLLAPEKAEPLGVFYKNVHPESFPLWFFGHFSTCFGIFQETC
ncbi:acyltransferase family protein [Serratia marcescens]